MNIENHIQLVEKVYSDFKESLGSIIETHSQLYGKIINDYDEIVSELKIRNIMFFL